jgi:chaperonin GroEL (HSP60 family)
MGMDKMFCDDLGEMTITNNGSTILKLLKIQNPVSKILADLALSQQSKCGDGTTSVVLITCELLRYALLLSKSYEIDDIMHDYMVAQQICDKVLSKIGLESEKTGGGAATEFMLYQHLCEKSPIIKAFANALLVIPRRLLASMEQNDLSIEFTIKTIISKSSPTESTIGIDVTNEEQMVCENVFEQGITDTIDTKKSIINLATKAACMVLRINQYFHE